MTPSTQYEQYADVVNEFEARVLAQESFDPTHYDDDYFASEWREGGNKYDLETRRRVEGEGPRRIMEVFQPARILDVGCGPGFLMHFLHEHGAEVEGIDFSPSSLVLAPDAIRSRIKLGPTDDLPFDDRSYDLVVCREVMEHLTVLQVRRTVAEICRVSARFAYVTTRFHGNPTSILDLTTDFETDPTHITLMTKSLLRLLFVLEGFRHRADLEDAMDWGGKGRVLVYERSG